MTTITASGTFQKACRSALVRFLAEQFAEKSERRAVINCPLCGTLQSLVLTRSATDYHVYAACKTNGCVEFELKGDIDMAIVSKTQTKEWDENYDRIFKNDGEYDDSECKPAICKACGARDGQYVGKREVYIRLGSNTCNVCDEFPLDDTDEG